VNRAARPTARAAGRTALACAFARALGAWLPLAAVAATAEQQPAPPPAACEALARLPLPRSGSARRSFLQRLEGARELCKGHPAFLSLLGAAWLEEGEPARALLWLERSLMLDPEQLGAQADHALALAALGEPQARDELVQRWRGRTDVPPALRERLRPPADVGGVASNGGRSTDGWVSLRELTLLAGYESNLDQSPTLDEITITLADGAVALPLESPLRPRAGAAAMAEGSWQLARSTPGGTLWLAGVRAGARHSPGNADTDWQQAQAAASVTQRRGDWRLSLQASAAAVGGNLNEPYRTWRLGGSVERETHGCVLRLLVETEDRRQQSTVSADGRTGSALASTLCPWPGRNDFTWGLAARYSVDEPRRDDRPGGAQRQGSLGLRLIGSAAGIQLDASTRVNRLVDVEGYSPLLADNARRAIDQLQASLELTYPMAGLGGALAVAQLQAVRQLSNLSIFSYTAISLYGGLRWQW
jgi:hypothetical protein